MEQDEDGQARSFKVHDRRRFSDTGEAREEAADRQEPEHEQSAAPVEQPAPETTAGESGSSADRELPEINFATFVISLSTQALAQLGEIPDPANHSTRIDLGAARQFIDILAMLQEKTKGNLDSDESSLLENALYDLRMRYIDRADKR